MQNTSHCEWCSYVYMYQFGVCTMYKYVFVDEEVYDDEDGTAAALYADVLI